MKLDVISFIFESTERLYLIQLMQESSFITEGLARKLKDEDGFDFMRINFMCRDKVIADGVAKVGNIASMNVQFDGEYFNMDSEKKEAYLYQLAENSFKSLSKAKGYDYSVFARCLDELKAEGHCHSFETGVEYDKNGQKAKLIGVQSMEKVDFFAVADGRDMKLVATSKPNDNDYFVLLGRLELDENGEFVLYDKMDNKVEIKTEE